MQRIAIIFSTLFLLIGLTGLAGLATIRIYARASGFDADRRREPTVASKIISENLASTIIGANYFGLAGLFIAYWIIVYFRGKTTMHKHLLFILCAIYGVALIGNFLVFYMAYQ